MSVDIPQAIAAVAAALEAEREAWAAYDRIPEGSHYKDDAFLKWHDAESDLSDEATNHAPTLLAAIASKDAEIERLRELLDSLYDPNPCSFDHHGHCQEHGWPHEGPCIMTQVAAALSGRPPSE